MDSIFISWPFSNSILFSFKSLKFPVLRSNKVLFLIQLTYERTQFSFALNACTILIVPISIAQQHFDLNLSCTLIGANLSKHLILLSLKMCICLVLCKEFCATHQITFINLHVDIVCSPHSPPNLSSSTQFIHHAEANCWKVQHGGRSLSTNISRSQQDENSRWRRKNVVPKSNKKYHTKHQGFEPVRHFNKEFRQ